MSDAPPKFISVDGIRKMNPEWKAWKAAQSGGGAPAAPTSSKVAPAPEIAVVCNRQEVAGTDIELNANIAETEKKIIADESAAKSMGLDSAALMEGLYQKMAVHEVPVGLLSKLLLLSELTTLFHVIDDSGSMSCRTDVKDSHGKWLTRWQEAKERLLTMLDICSWIPGCPKTIVSFLNRSTEIELKRNDGETPQAFFERSKAAIEHEFNNNGPRGGTPFAEKISAALARFGENTGFWFWGDGTPNGGASAQERITREVSNRANPARRPVTFMSCTNNDDDVAWMKEAEEVASFCSEGDDFNDEAAEVRADQGSLIPYTRGFYLVSLLVAAMDPVLDGLDESVPLTKSTFDDLLGYKTTTVEYGRYFDGMVAAQRKKRPTEAMGKLSKEYIEKFHAIRSSFETAATAGDIELVVEFRRKAREIVFDEKQRQEAQRTARNEPVASSHRQQHYHQQQQDDDCCCVVA